MSNQARCSYRGCSITTRWLEVGSMPHHRIELDSRSGVRQKRFTASFSVDPVGTGEESWQQFPKTAFDTCVHAAENALATAKRSIDLKLTEE